MYDVDDSLNLHEEPKFPKTVLIAGLLWILLGTMGVGILCTSFVLRLTRADNEPIKTLDVVFRFGQLLIAANFILVGFQTMRGAIRHPIRISIVSIVIGVCILFAVGVLMIVKEVAGATIGLACAVGFIAPGILSLLGRNDYIAWRKEQKRRARNIEER